MKRRIISLAVIALAAENQDQQDRVSADGWDQCIEQSQGVGIGPFEVVNYDDQGTAMAQQTDQLDQRDMEPLLQSFGAKVTHPLCLIWWQGEPEQTG